MKCNYCGKEILNAGSLVVHEKYYCKSNPLIKHKKSNFTNYNKKLRSGEIQKEVKERYTKLKLAPYSGFMNPDFLPIIKDGKITRDDFLRRVHLDN